MDNGIEIFGWFVYFWLFIFSKNFRSAWIEEFKEGGIPEKLYKSWEGVVSVLFGLAPLLIIYMLLKQ